MGSSESTAIKMHSKVKLSKDSEFYYPSDWDENNPKDIVGVVVKVGRDAGLPIRVYWSNGKTNSYNGEDLVVLGQGVNFGKMYFYNMFDPENLIHYGEIGKPVGFKDSRGEGLHVGDTVDAHYKGDIYENLPVVEQYVGSAFVMGLAGITQCGVFRDGVMIYLRDPYFKATIDSDCIKVIK